MTIDIHNESIHPAEVEKLVRGLYECELELIELETKRMRSEDKLAAKTSEIQLHISENPIYKNETQRSAAKRIAYETSEYKILVESVRTDELAKDKCLAKLNLLKRLFQIRMEVLKLTVLNSNRTIVPSLEEFDSQYAAQRVNNV